MVRTERSPGGLANGISTLMRPRLPFPVEPFDLVPPLVVERCKQIFSLWPVNGGIFAFAVGPHLVSGRLDGTVVPPWRGPLSANVAGDFPAAAPGLTST